MSRKNPSHPIDTESTEPTLEVEPSFEEEFSSEGSDREQESVLFPEVEEEEEESASMGLVLADEAKRGALSRTDPLARYMAEANRYPLLSREEEHEPAVRYVEQGDLDAAYRLVTSNLRLVVKIAYQYRRAAFNILDLIQEGNVGLMHAVRKYDPFKGVKLSSYAAWWIRAYILRFIMDNWRMVKLGTTEAQRKLFFNLRKEQAKLASEGFAVGPKLLAERLGVSEEEVVEMDQRLSGDEVWLDTPVGEDGDSTWGERLESPWRPADETLGSEQIKERLREEMEEFAKTLDERERYIFDHRLTSDDPLTLQQIGDHFGVSRERARQIEAKMVKGLRERLRERMPDLEWEA